MHCCSGVDAVADVSIHKHQSTVAATGLLGEYSFGGYTGNGMVLRDKNNSAADG